LNNIVPRPTFDQAADKPASHKAVRLLLWAPNGAGLHYNGPGMSAYRLYSNLTATDPLAISLAHGFPGQPRYPLFSEQHFISPVTGSIGSQAAFIWQGRRWLTQHHRSFDVFYGLQAFDFTVKAAELAQKLGLPAIVKVVQHKADLADRTGWRSLLGRARARRRTVAALSGVVAISDAIHEELVAYGIPEGKIARIPNGVDTDHFRPCRDDKEQAELRARFNWPNEPTVIFVGAIIPRKRPHLLVEALGLLKSSQIRPALVLAGPVKDEEYGRQIRKRADDLGVGGQITWTGFVADTAQLYQAADVFSLLSANEGMPNALLEAMACGLPSVVTQIPGTSDLVRNGEEALIVESTTESVADALSQYVRSQSLRNRHGSAARKRADDVFSARRVLERHIQLYQRVVAGKEAAE
jgi:glycosyltransferase involved in cell wall biosynthesis